MPKKEEPKKEPRLCPYCREPVNDEGQMPLQWQRP